MSVLSIAHYNLHASRQAMDALRDFYCSVIGLREGPRPPFTRPGYWLYAEDEPIVHLVETRAGETRASGVATTFDHVAFYCKDRGEMEARLRSHSVEFTVDRVPQLGQVQLFLKDPAGNGIELNFSED